MWKLNDDLGSPQSHKVLEVTLLSWVKELTVSPHWTFFFPVFSGAAYPLPSCIFVCWSMYQIFDSSSLWPVSLVKRFPNLVAFVDRGQLQTVPWSFPEESYWDLIFSERCSLQSMSGPLSHLRTPIGLVAMALHFSPLRYTETPQKMNRCFVSVLNHTSASL